MSKTFGVSTPPPLPAGLRLLVPGPPAIRTSIIGLVTMAWRAGWRRGLCEGRGCSYPEGLEPEDSART